MHEDGAAARRRWRRHPARARPLPRTRTGALSAGLLCLLALAPCAMAQEEQQARRAGEVFAEVLQFLLENYVDETRLNPETLLDGALEGMFEALDDPHSAYVQPSDVRQITDLTRGEFGGVGMYIGRHADGGFEVISPIEGNPAHRAGVRAGDLIMAINGESAAEFDLADIVARLRGPPGTTVTMTLLRDGSIEFDTVMEREMIEVETVRFGMIGERIGYLRIVQFTLLTPERVSEALHELGGAAALIIDLRSNPGGLLGSVVQVADYFLSDGVIVSTQARVDADNDVHRAGPAATIVDASVPIVILIDRGSASASEILAAALGESGRGFLLGEQSYGKASVQQVRRFGSRAVKLTTAYYLTPSGASIDQVGISPHLAFGDTQRTEEEEAEITELFEGGHIRRFVREHADPSEALIEEFISELRDSGVDLPRRMLRKLVHDEVVRRMPERPVYDLRFDGVLREAVRMLDLDLVPARDAWQLREPAAAAAF
ncbi:MAG: S41 family peptidase [Spirochaetaceae bacterium]|nr:S41 family peptidase [Spirochaetaceae bacterium]